MELQRFTFYRPVYQFCFSCWELSELSIYIGSIGILVVIGQGGIVHAVSDTPPSQVSTTCTIDRVANMYPNEGDGPSIFSTPLASAYFHGWPELRYLNTA
nr:MAG TPA: hypothetical protein [Caudoviricetes sp.]